MSPRKRRKRQVVRAFIILGLLGVLQVFFGVALSYMVAAVDDNVWHGWRLDHMRDVALATGLPMAITGFVCAAMAQDIMYD